MDSEKFTEDKLRGDRFSEMTADEIRDAIVEKGIKFEKAIYGILPDDCALKIQRCLVPDMFFVFNEKMVVDHRVGREDVCTFCTVEACRHYRVRFKRLRAWKVYLLGKIFYRDSLL